MFKRASQWMRGVLSLMGYLVNTLFWSVPIMLFSFLKLLVPIPAWRRWCTRILNGSANNWIAVNRWHQNLLTGTRLVVQGADQLRRDNWYLVLANHQSWVDILVLQHVFYKKIPFLKFFLKKELFWVPVLGQCWWALEFPFMKRYSKSFLKKNPHLKGTDIETTRKACEKFRTVPVSIMNFVEGSRFSLQKKQIQHSPYKNLLKTRAGGVAHVLAAMSDQLDRILDVTIVYPGGIKDFWAYACGEIDEIKVRINAIEITPELMGDYVSDRTARARFHSWLNRLWEDKDRLIDTLRHPGESFDPARAQDAGIPVFPGREPDREADCGCA